MKRILVFVLILIVCYVGWSIYAAKQAEIARAKACASVQRILTAGIEMYNMDHSTPMQSLDMETLLKEKYIKPITPPDSKCKYESVRENDKRFNLRPNG